MKNSMSILAFLLLAQITFAQKTFTEESDPRATTILNKVNKQFENLTSYELDFSVSMTTPDSQKPQTEKGKFIRQGAQYRVITHDQKIYCDGQNIWIFTPKSNEVQINDADDDDTDFVSPDKLFNLYKSEDYLYHISNEYKEKNKKLVEIEFKPTDRMSEFFKIKMVINQNINQPQSVKIFYKDGLRVTMKLSGLKKNKTYPKGFFSFDKAKFPGVKVEDLRL
ncbi:MAG TPA: outer membrane lipoprotein carrier protein LolA [Saprospiraceae bacterium]|nr:outer membrane lipoprotein carrier protein LolA [Saprospiraceae bacterium]